MQRGSGKLSVSHNLSQVILRIILGGQCHYIAVQQFVIHVDANLTVTYSGPAGLLLHHVQENDSSSTVQTLTSDFVMCLSIYEKKSLCFALAKDDCHMSRQGGFEALSADQ